MTTTIQAFTHLSHRAARSFHRLFNRLTREAKLGITLTLAIPPFRKVNFTDKADLQASAHGESAPRAGM